MSNTSQPVETQFVSKDLITEITEIADFLVSKGWAERNGGNFSIRLTDETILITNTGAKFRDIKKDPLAHCGIIKLANGQATFHSADATQKPSSELPTHLLLHNYLSKNNDINKVILHTHPTHLIAFSHKFVSPNSQHPKAVLNTLLQSTMPEVEMFVPAGIGFVDLYPPGSAELADATLAELQAHNVVLWHKHGCLATGKSLWDAVDMIDIIDKAAYIQLLI